MKIPSPPRDLWWLLILAIIIVFVLRTVAAWPAHLLRQVPAAVAAQIRKGCEQSWPDSAFNQGWCADQDAAAWLAGRRDKPPAAHGQELMVRPPDIMIRPKENQQ